MVSNGNVTGLAERLVQEGLVSREASAHDRRSQRVRLTPAGKRAFDAMTPAHRHWTEDLMADLGRDEMQRLHELLGRLKLSLEAAEARRLKTSKTEPIP
jgi:DNA-binding MarR family transcriptional regulator